jgi:hypothetical protein
VPAANKGGMGGPGTEGARPRAYDQVTLKRSRAVSPPGVEGLPDRPTPKTGGLCKSFHGPEPTLTLPTTR